MFIVSPYGGLAKDLIEQVKFERAMAGSKDISQAMVDRLPLFPDGLIVCHIPTAPKRIRIRGYDQSLLIAKHLSKELKLQHSPLLARVGNARQLGSSRKERFGQAQKSYRINPKYKIKGETILLVDDVTTSGATMEAAASLLKKAGAKEVNGVVFAQAVD